MSIDSMESHGSSCISSNMPAIRTRRTRHRQSHPYHVGPAQLPLPASPPAYSNPPPPPPPYHVAITQPAYLPQGAAVSLSMPAIGAISAPSLPAQTTAIGIPAAVTAIGAATSANLNGPVASPANATPTPVPTPAFPAQAGTRTSVDPPAFTAAAPTNVNGPVGASTSASTATSFHTEAASESEES
ncbi:hypothetical protein B0H11DRAFT_1898250 [Mycena galericulata]|nr:hypothetical protein B0H11DRAFT_1898250 [Mycena galericulata]